MRRSRRDIKIQILFFLIRLEVDLAGRSDRNSQVKEYQVVDVAVTGPLKGPPVVQASKEAGPFEWLAWGVNPYAYSVVNKPFEEQ
jgi:hypothetical protein